MLCPNCNKENNPGVSFCVNCGTKLNAEPQQVPSTPPSNPYEYKEPSTTINNNPYIQNNNQQFAQDVFPQQNTTPNVATQPINGNPLENEKTNKTAKKLAIISLSLLGGRYVLAILGVFLSGIITYLSYEYGSGSSYGESSLFGHMFSGLAVMSYIASIVLAIIAKVKISSKKLKNTFVNVVFWVQMGLLIADVLATVLLFVLLFATCGALIGSCN